MSSGDVVQVKREPSISTISVSSDEQSKSIEKRTQDLFEAVINECYANGLPKERRHFTQPMYRRFGFIAPIGVISAKVTRLLDALKGELAPPRWIKRRDLLNKITECAKKYKSGELLEEKKKNEANRALIPSLEQKKAEEEMKSANIVQDNTRRMLEALSGERYPPLIAAPHPPATEQMRNAFESLEEIKEEGDDSTIRPLESKEQLIEQLREQNGRLEFYAQIANQTFKDLQEQLVQKDAQIQEMTKALLANRQIIQKVGGNQLVAQQQEMWN